MRRYYDARAAEYDEWYLGTGRFAERDRPGWEDELAAVAGVLAALPPARTLDVACGTAFLSRHLRGLVVGIDQSPAMVEVARRKAAAEGLAGRIEFRVGDAHALDDEAGSFDVAIAHTLVSHVTDPPAVVGEMARVVRPGGSVAIFDGDYALLTFGFADPPLGKAVDEALAAAVVNNPRVLRDLPRLLREVGLELVEATGHVYAEVGNGRFFANLAEAYAPLVTRAGLLPAARVDGWLAGQRRALAEGTFFGACNYYAYVLRRPDAGS